MAWKAWEEITTTWAAVVDVWKNVVWEEIYTWEEFVAVWEDLGYTVTSKVYVSYSMLTQLQIFYTNMIAVVFAWLVIYCPFTTFWQKVRGVVINQLFMRGIVWGTYLAEGVWISWRNFIQFLHWIFFSSLNSPKPTPESWPPIPRLEDDFSIPQSAYESTFVRDFKPHHTPDDFIKPNPKPNPEGWPITPRPKSEFDFQSQSDALSQPVSNHKQAAFVSDFKVVNIPEGKLPNDKPAESFSYFIEIPNDKPAESVSSFSEIPNDKPAESVSSFSEIPNDKPAESVSSFSEIPNYNPAESDSYVSEIPNDIPYTGFKYPSPGWVGGGSKSPAFAHPSGGETELAKFLSPFIHWAEEIDTSLAEFLSLFIHRVEEIYTPLAEFLSPFIHRAEEIYTSSAEFLSPFIHWVGIKLHWEYCLIPLITIIILGLVWIDSITANVTFLKPVRTTKNLIITQISRIWTPEGKWIISVIISLFLYYFHIKYKTVEIALMYYIVPEYLIFGLLVVGLRIVSQWLGNPSTEDLYISVLSKLFINPVQKFLQTVFKYVESIFYKVLPGKSFPLKGMTTNMAASLSLLVCIHGRNYTEHYCPGSIN